MDEIKVLDGYIIQIGNKYVSGWDSEYGETELSDDIRYAQIVTWMSAVEHTNIEDFAKDSLTNADPRDLGDNQDIRIHRCQLTILD